MTQILQANEVNLACHIAEKFTKLYYNILDKQRNIISKMYMDNAVLMWNGNGVVGKANIEKFWIDLAFSEYTTYTLDAQPIINPEINDQLTFLIKVSGEVKYKQSSKMFTQTFLITIVDKKWKIINDCF